jgi:ribosomal protein S12 methylthiotransferase
MRESESPTFYIENLGCAKNQVDAEVLLSQLEGKGWRYRETTDEAALIILNTCGFIRPAKDEAINTFFELRSLYPDKKILLAGCFAQRYGRELADRIPEADGIFGNHDLKQIGAVAEEVMEGHTPVVVPDWDPTPVRRTRLFSPKGSSYVKISEGCDHRCSFCAIPLIRGPLRSFPMEEVMEQVRAVRALGAVEINLIAQDLAAYGNDRGSSDFPLLLRKISGLEGDFWLRLLYIHPDNFPLEILPILRDDPRILPYFDIPFQHASKRILRRMGRGGDAKSYAALVERIRRKLPDAVLRTTFLVGFPGEGKKDFEELKAFQRDVGFDWAGVFSFSSEEGTPAHEMRGSLAERLGRRRVEKRREELELLQTEISSLRMDRFIGRTLRILVEERVKGEDLALGRAYLQAPEVDGASVILSGRYAPGDWVDMKVMKRNNFDLEVFPLDELV